MTHKKNSPGYVSDHQLFSRLSDQFKKEVLIGAEPVKKEDEWFVNIRVRINPRNKRREIYEKLVQIGRPQKMSNRDLKILFRWLSGLTYRESGAAYNVSPKRTHQIISCARYKLENASKFTFVPI